MSKAKSNHIMLQGHRGCTGYYPENSIEGFLHAIDIGVSALELDLVVSQDNQLIVSHEPFFRSGISLDPFGKKILEADEVSHNIYTKSVAEIKTYTCIPDNRFPQQKQIKHTKPTLKELVLAIKNHCQINSLKEPRLTIEIKSRKNWENKFQPSAKSFAKIIDEFHQKYLQDSDVLYHSFDTRILVGLSQLGYKNLDYLTDDSKWDIASFLAITDFQFSGVGLHYTLVNEAMVEELDKHGLTLSVWTVNSQEEIARLLKLGVQNIITDYPLMAKEIIVDSGRLIV